ncbi:MAG: carbohydrate kinase family protein [Caulobacteraceae bacterium]|nr:carbohydrate kinase family protein [Caulobacteraceae bacterium]
MGQGLLSIGLTTLDISARPVDALPPDDTTALVDKIVLAPAGTAAGAALVAATLGVRTRLAGCVGDDAAGRLVRSELQAAGVDTGLLAELEGAPTSVTILPIKSSGQRPNLHAMGAGGHVEDSEALREAARAARFVHYAAVRATGLSDDAGAALLKDAKAAGAVVTCDLISPRASILGELKLILPHVDYFMPNASEARFLTGRDDLADAARTLLDWGAGACVFTDGAAGSVLADAAGLRRFPAHAIKPVDTTSCGDSYCAGFIAGLDRDWDVEDACRLGGAVSALVALGLGTTGALTDFAAAERLMRDGVLPDGATSGAAR